MQSLKRIGFLRDGVYKIGAAKLFMGPFDGDCKALSLCFENKELLWFQDTLPLSEQFLVRFLSTLNPCWPKALTTP